MVVVLGVLEHSDSVITLLMKHSHQVYLGGGVGAMSGTRACGCRDEQR